ncbi:MAG: energy transducer TonB [Candidatus Acidiferrum sp.]
MNSKVNVPSAGSPLAPEGGPVAHEVPVTATGARPGQNSGKRELFTEATTTVLVFSNGGVIRLAVAVEPGQLLFLTSQQTKREVVTQVKNRRDNPGSGFYVELEFTEPTPDFWGIKLSENPATSPVNRQQRAAATEAIRRAEPDSDDPGQSELAPSASEIQGLMNEVEELRSQLISLQTQGAAPITSTPPAASVSSSAPPPPLSDLFSSFLAPGAQPAPPQPTSGTPKSAAPNPASVPLPQLSDMLSSILTPAAPAATPPKTSPTPESQNFSNRGTASSLPVEAPSTQDDDSIPEPKNVPEENLASEPERASLQTQTPKKIPPVSKPKEASSDRLGHLRLALLAAVSLFAVSVAAWNLHWFSFSSGAVSPAGRASSLVRAALHPSSPARPVTPQKSGAQLDSGAASQASSPASSQPDSALASTQPSSSSSPHTNSPSVPSHAADESASSRIAAANSAPRESSERVTSVASRSSVPPASALAPISPALPGENAGTVPPKLIKSVRAVAPAEALRDFMTGNVTLDALIDESGRVKSMKILSGPEMFHKAAIEALRQYRYEPARRNGKRVSAHITVLVPFWFEP